MIEKKISISTLDGFKIHMIKSFSGRGSKRAIFIIHGLTSCVNDYAYKRAADYFSKKYDVYRIELYSGESKGRTIVDCTIQTHADDINLVISKYAKKYDKVFMIGHSYGGPSIMEANPDNIAAVSLWDPSFNFARLGNFFDENKQFIRDGRYWTLSWGNVYLVGKDMGAERLKYNLKYCRALSKSFKAPVQVIFAGDGIYVNDKYSYHSFGNKKNCKTVIRNADHCFTSNDTCDKLLLAVDKWFSKF